MELTLPPPAPQCASLRTQHCHAGVSQLGPALVRRRCLTDVVHIFIVHAKMKCEKDLNVPLLSSILANQLAHCATRGHTNIYFFGLHTNVIMKNYHKKRLRTCVGVEYVRKTYSCLLFCGTKIFGLERGRGGIHPQALGKM